MVQWSTGIVVQSGAGQWHSKATRRKGTATMCEAKVEQSSAWFMTKLTLSPDVAKLNPGLETIELTNKVRLRVQRLAGEPEFRSDTEARAWREWVPGQGAIRALYEPYTLHLTGGSYTPDIVLLFSTGEHWLIEVKGSWKAHQSGRSSKRNLRQASIEFAFLGRWFSLMPDGRQDWRLEEFNP